MRASETCARSSHDAPPRRCALCCASRRTTTTRDGWDLHPSVLLAVEDASGDYDVLADLDGRYLSTEVATGFTGRVVGVYAIGGTARFDWFDFKAINGAI